MDFHIDSHSHHYERPAYVVRQYQPRYVRQPSIRVINGQIIPSNIIIQPVREYSPRQALFSVDYTSSFNMTVGSFGSSNTPSESPPVSAGEPPPYINSHTITQYTPPPVARPPVLSQEDIKNSFMRDCMKWYQSIGECTRIWNSDPDATPSD